VNKKKEEDLNQKKKIKFYYIHVLYYKNSK